MTKRKSRVYKVYLSTELNVKPGEVANSLIALLNLNPAKKVHFESVDDVSADYNFYRDNDGQLIAQKKQDSGLPH